ncbi:MAG: 2-keto-3-deoxy-L-fuconate dehydrogenase [Gammaproteobacteria bacterium]|jgi:2-keto-3-deoxy-L-fuconate dehydrogenase
MANFDFTGKRVVITHAHAFMGPTLVDVFREYGAEVIADSQELLDAPSVAALFKHAGSVDILIANLGVPAPSTKITDSDEEEWRHVFSRMVDPLPLLLRAVLPQMTERGAGRVLVMGSASALRGMKRTSTYSAARGAQLAFVQAVGVELAPQNIQVNAIAQNFVDNPTYFPADLQANPAFQARLQREVPLGRLVSPREDAEFAAYLCSDAAACFVGQIFPVCGGWVQR